MNGNGSGAPMQDKRFVGWVLGINGALIVAGIGVVGSILWNQNASIIAMTSDIRGAIKDIGDLRIQLTNNESKDRESFLKMISPVMDRNLYQDQQLDKLSEWVTRMDERDKTRYTK